MKQPYIGNTKINKLYKGSELWCNWSSGGGGESGNNQYLLYSFTNFDVDNSIANKKIYSDNNNAYLEIKGNATNFVLMKSSSGVLRTNGSLVLNVECKDIINSSFTVELTIRLIKLNTIEKKVIFQCISAITPYDGFKVMVVNNNKLNLLSFVDNIDINANETLNLNNVLKLKLTKGNNIIKLYKNDNLSITANCKDNWPNFKSLSIGGNVANNGFVLGTYEFISLKIYDRGI